ncbi:MAG: hypothetical protein A3K19_26345 [Lentisphaerae bacterium RIFOXYB12_FULL_65_16]|nr:MAG: hypothetical protein A3K18_08515 [Lentisphaerae bacterium RIFOXYA12_64_32]OGV87796.1 MAG: hypothetical protein A3K19_26345 [Lentisphaerae bacterium RIFOXYB12_FULL_65_16]
MIKLCSQHALVVGYDGRQRPFSFDVLREELRLCFRQCGVAESWQAEHIALVIEEQILEAQGQLDAQVAEAEMDAMVTSVLLASGFGDVAATYRDRRKTQPHEMGKELFAAWDEVRLERQLAGFIPLSRAALPELVGRVKRALADLGLREVSDGLIQELGAHLLRNSVRDSDAEQGVPDAGDVIGPAEWSALLTDAQRDLLDRGAVRLLPISAIFPRARIELDLSRVIPDAVQRPLAEIVFLPGLHRACGALRDTLVRVRGELCRRRPQAAQFPGHLIVKGMEILFESHLVPMRRRDADVLVREVDEIVRAAIVTRVPFEVTVSTHAR